MTSIDINCDMGEGMGNEDQLMPYISSCSIACGGHAGDLDSIKRVIGLAQQHQVKIGAHPSYPDRANFGRKTMSIPPDTLIDRIRAQLERFMTVAKEMDAICHHIKPHGALYNDIARDEALAQVFLTAIEVYKSIPLYVPYASVIQKAAEQQEFKVITEAFLDRRYHQNLQLVSRNATNALIQHPEQVFEQLNTIVNKRQVATVEGITVELQACTFCIHGDTSEALKILVYLQQQMKRAHIILTK
ncbi:MAG: 5-oxoprolinase subunit PxpA [Bacteroidota bacterium]